MVSVQVSVMVVGLGLSLISVTVIVVGISFVLVTVIVFPISFVSVMVVGFGMSFVSVTVIYEYWILGVQLGDPRIEERLLIELGK